MTILPYIETILAILIITAILLQRSDSNVGGAFGGSDSLSSAYHTRRGFEKVLFNGTIVLGVLFVITSILLIIR